MKQAVERSVEQFFADFEAGHLEGYRRFFSDPLVVITPGVGLMRGLEKYLEYESELARRRKRDGCRVGWEDRCVDLFGSAARATGQLVLSFSNEGKIREVRQIVSFMLEQRPEGWRCFHVQGTPKEG